MRSTRRGLLPPGRHSHPSPEWSGLVRTYPGLAAAEAAKAAEAAAAAAEAAAAAAAAEAAMGS